MKLNLYSAPAVAMCKSGGNARANHPDSVNNRSGALIKMLLIMRMTAIILLATFLQASATTYSQRVTIVQDGIELEDVFESIKKQTGFEFLYNQSLLDATKPITIHLQNVALKEALNKCLEGLPLKYTIQSNIIVISADPIAGGLLSPAAALQDISGKVTDEKNTPLHGVSVHLEQLNKTTMTNEEGRFNFTGIAPGNYTIKFSIIGYGNVTRKISVKQSNVPVLNVQLKVVLDELDETVVIAYGSTTRRLNTGSVGRVTAEEIARQPVANVLQALQGRVAGLEVVQMNGYSSAPINLQIRGRKDLHSDINLYESVSDPLYVIDGTPIMAGYGDPSNKGLNQNGFAGPAGGQSPLFGLNPSDVESIEVLRDADATTIYGSRAANGVILITTKKATAGRSVLNLNAYTGFSVAPKKVELLNTQEYLEMRKEAFKNDGTDYNEAWVNAPDLKTWDQNRYTDWQKELASNSKTSDVQLSYSAGNEYTNFRFSGGYHRQTPPIPEGFRKKFYEDRYSALTTISHQSSNRKFSASLTANFSSTRSNIAGSGVSNFLIAPNAPALLDSAGNLNWKEYGSNVLDGFLGLFQPYKANTVNMSGSINLRYEIINNLSLNLNAGYAQTRMDQLYIRPKSVGDPADTWSASVAQYGFNNFQTWSLEPNLNWAVNVGPGKLQLLVGSSLQNNLTTGNYLNGSGYADEALMEFLGGAKNLSGSSNYAQYRYQGAFARMNYNLDNKYIFNLSARRDASSRFRSGRQFANFGSAAGAWIFSQEKFFNNFKAISYGKLRASYGTTGSASVGDYDYLSLWNSLADLSYGDESVLRMTQASNADYSWQVNHKMEMAMELGFFQDKVLFSAAYYRELNDDQLVISPMPVFVSAFSIAANIPAKVENKGWEFTLSASNVRTENFSWNTALNISFNRNKLLAFPGIEQGRYRDIYVVGKPLSIQKKLYYLGVNPDNGHYMFEDVDKSGSVSPWGLSNDRTGVVNFAPDFFGGLRNDFSFKGWNLGFLFEFKKQKGPYGLSLSHPGGMMNQPIGVLTRWQQAGDQTNMARFTTQGFAPDISNFQQSNANIVDASYARLQNLSLSYNFPQRWLAGLQVSNVSVYAQGQNLFTISNYKGLDPASPTLSANFPPQKFFTGGFQITF